MQGKRLWWVVMLVAVVGCGKGTAEPTKTGDGVSLDHRQSRQINRNDVRLQVLEAKVAALAIDQGVTLDVLEVVPVASDGPLEEGPDQSHNIALGHGSLYETTTGNASTVIGAKVWDTPVHAAVAEWEDEAGSTNRGTITNGGRH